MTSKFFSLPSKKRQNVNGTRPSPYTHSSPPFLPPASHLRAPDPSIPPPTVSQIAMGLHLSRTPHLRKSKRSSPPLPPPPSRSAMKTPYKSHKHSTSLPAVLPAASHSSTTVASQTPQNALHSPSKSARSLASFSTSKSRLLSRFLPSYISGETTPSSYSTSDTAADVAVTVKKPKKAVRFSTSALGLNDKAAQSGTSA